jgi:hypothetical protein
MAANTATSITQGRQVLDRVLSDRVVCHADGRWLWLQLRDTHAV